MNDKEKFIKNSAWSFFTAIISRIGTLIFTILIAKLLLPEKYGMYSIVFAVAMVFFGFTDLGINQTLTRYIALALSRDRKKLASYYSYLLKLKFILAIAFSLLLIALSYPLSNYVFKNSSLFLPFVISGIYVFILSFESFYTQIFYSLEKIKYLGFKEILNQGLKIILLLLVFYSFSAESIISWIFISFIITSLFLLFFNLFYTKKLVPGMYSESLAKINKKRVNKFIFYLTATSIFGILFSYIDTITLGIFLNPEFVGYYRAALSLIVGIAGFLSFPNALILPLLMKTKQPYQLIFSKIQKYLFLLSIPAVFGLLILGKYIIRIFYGYEYLPSVMPFNILAFLIPLIVCSSAFIPFFSAKEVPKITAFIVIISSLLNIVLNFVFVKIFISFSELMAVAGVSLSVLISWLVFIVLSAYFLKKKFSLSINARFVIKPAIAGVIMSFVLLLVMTLIKDVNYLSGAFLIILGMLVYFLALFLIKGLAREDLIMLKTILKK